MRRRQALTFAASIGAAVLLALVGCSGSGPDDEPESERDGFSRAAAGFIEAVSSDDAARYRSLLPPDQRPTLEQARDSLDNTTDDVGGCDASDAEFRTSEGNGGVYVDVIFAEPCGDFGVTDACNLWYRRFDGYWWVAQWSCSKVVS